MRRNALPIVLSLLVSCAFSCKQNDTGKVNRLVATMERGNSPKAQREAASELGLVGGDLAIDGLLRVATGNHPIDLRRAALASLETLAGCETRECTPRQEARRIILGLMPLWKEEGMSAEATYIPVALEDFLARIGSVSYEPVVGALGDPQAVVRMRAAQTLGRIGNARARDKLAPLLEDPDGQVRRAASKALARLGK